jgi:hypothetical protein
MKRVMMGAFIYLFHQQQHHPSIPSHRSLLVQSNTHASGSGRDLPGYLLNMHACNVKYDDQVMIYRLSFNGGGRLTRN